MTEILIIRDREGSWMNTNVYRNGEKLNSVQSYSYSLKVEHGASLKLKEIIPDTMETEVTGYRESLGDKIILITYLNLKQFLEELRNENSILLRQ